MSANPAQAYTGFDPHEVLCPDVYRELRKLATSHMLRQQKNQTLQPTVLVHEAWLRLVRQGRKWRDQGHFFATASLAMRHILIDHARRKASIRHGAGLDRLTSEKLRAVAAPNQADVILLLNEGISELANVHPERAQVVVDRFFGGLTNDQIAGTLGISERTVERHWAMAKIWLLRWMQETAPSQQWPIPDPFRSGRDA